MIKGGPELGDRGYAAEHIAEVQSDLTTSVPAYFESLLEHDLPIGRRFADELKRFKREQQSYVDLFNLDTLDEYSYDPNGFKADLRRACPIIRRCLNSPAKVMDGYKRSFNYTDGATILEKTENIVRFAHRHILYFEPSKHESIRTIEDLGLAEADADDYTVSGVIGGGIRSRFLYMLYPRMFPNRSQNAI